MIENLERREKKTHLNLFVYDNPLSDTARREQVPLLKNKFRVNLQGP